MFTQSLSDNYSVLRFANPWTTNGLDLTFHATLLSGRLQALLFLITHPSSTGNPACDLPFLQPASSTSGIFTRSMVA